MTNKQLLEYLKETSETLEILSRIDILEKKDIELIKKIGGDLLFKGTAISYSEWKLNNKEKMTLWIKMEYKNRKNISKKIDKAFNDLTDTLNIEQIKLFKKYIELKYDSRMQDLDDILEVVKKIKMSRANIEKPKSLYCDCGNELKNEAEELLGVCDECR